MATSGTPCSPPTARTRGAFGILPRTQCEHHDLNGTCVHSCRRRSSSVGSAGSLAARLVRLSAVTPSPPEDTSPASPVDPSNSSAASGSADKGHSALSSTSRLKLCASK
eukprot:4668234-Alexandrium_andersonii.AAC.1